jgi:glycosyltransferase involved in cell wall biosynthesis
MDPVKVLVISDYRSETSARPEAEAMIGLQQAGLDITIMTYDQGRYPQKFREAGIKVIAFHPEKKFDRKEINFIREEMKNGGYEILQLFNSKAIINGISAAKSLPVKIFLYRGFTGNVLWYDPLAWFKYLHPRVDKIICLTAAIKKSIDKNLFFNRSKTVIIKKGHSPEWYKEVKPAERSELNIPTNAFVVTIVSNVRAFKGIPYFIRSSYHLPGSLPIHFLMIGKNMDKPVLQKLIDKSRFKNNFHLPGFINDPLPCIAASHVIVLASTRGEGINKTVVEAMSLGIPAIITNIENNKDLFVKDADELLVPVRNSKAIAEAIFNLYKNPERKRELGLRSKEHVTRHLNIEDTINQIKNLYQELANHKST